MGCDEVRKRLTAWADGELPPREAERIDHHLSRCPACRLEAHGQRQLSAALNTLPAVIVPAGLAERTRRVFRTRLERPGLAQWWQQLSLVMRGAVCGAALAGLLCGAVLGTSLSRLAPDNTANLYQTLYADNGIFP
ncbi:hypothetical protein DESC_700189 [Desulfosarcina cetonica]|uniref:anti-sigma factor family protein n=1 Tax=Desulfosarcina cetonica TaxID=90730 RepID=UPI0006D194BA|nr:zf-HC2 domain-containing protein [Desulfosarcina cetonica]VTR68433.1 hypothetical protein DESC_700189 [Desulfosarcina cetonica]